MNTQPTTGRSPSQPQIQELPDSRENHIRVALEYMEDKLLAAMLRSVIIDPERMEEMHQALNRALSTWEERPPALMAMVDHIHMHVEPPQVKMSQQQARAVKYARVRMPRLLADDWGDGTQALARGDRVSVQFIRSYRVAPEGHPGSDLIHEFVCIEQVNNKLVFVEHSRHLYDFSVD